MKLYRVMKVDADGKPRVGDRGFMLGVRPQGGPGRADVDATTITDLVKPGEGLSTSQIPDVLTVRRNEALFAIETDSFDVALEVNPDNPPHCLIQSRKDVPLGEFQQLLADTRELWELVQQGS